MKAKLIILLAVTLILTTQCAAQRQITVQAESNDISNNLDLKAVATVFGQSKNLEEFEMKLNDYDSGISNLDLNNDGQVDYLRVIEKYDNGIHAVVIQSVLDEDVYQDVATIVVDKDQYSNNASIQIVGNPYLYGPNYIIEPSYIYTPSIFSIFWQTNYRVWHSPYYWGYYPTYYHHRSPLEMNIYLGNVYRHINHDNRYYYSNNIRNRAALNVVNTISRNDYATRYPDRNFTNRNSNIRNKRDLEFTRNGVMRNTVTRSGNENGGASMSRPARNSDNQERTNQAGGWNQRNATNNASRENTFQNRSNSYETGDSRNNTMQNRGQNTYTAPTNVPSNNNRNAVNNNSNQNSTYQSRQNQNNSNSSEPVRRNDNFQQRSNDNNNSNNNRINPQVAPQRTQTPAPQKAATPVVKEQRQAEPARSTSSDRNEKSDSRR
jgi:hypothetical protein